MKTDITFVLDRSGSMDSIRLDTIGGFNAFIDDQRKEPAECTVSLVQFDNTYEPLFTGRPLAQVPELTLKTYQPRGGTALLDAIGMTIDRTGARLAALPEWTRPDQVKFVIITDGEENASSQFTLARIHDMITHQREIYQWEFVFLGANQDAIKAGMAMGMMRGQSMSVAANAAGTHDMYSTVSQKMRASRATGQSVGFDEEDRAKQRDHGAI